MSTDSENKELLDEVRRLRELEEKRQKKDGFSVGRIVVALLLLMFIAMALSAYW